MIKAFPIIFILLWSSAFITTQPIVDNSDPFSALAFRFFLVSVGDRLKSGKLNKNNTGLWSETKNPTKEYGSNIVIENQNIVQ